MIAAIIGLVAGLWLVAHGLTEAYGHRQDHLARTWYASGNNALRAGRFKAAVLDLQTAVVYSHESPEYRLRLAEALAADGRIKQAQAYLRALWEEQPGDATVNLQLARLAVRSANLADAERYYNGAIYGVWATDPVRNRRDTRLELVRFLLGHDLFQRAQSQLITVAADEPREPGFMVQIGRMFLDAGDAGRALEQFRAAAALQPINAAAFAGGGLAAFQQGDYLVARHYFERAVALNPADNESAGLLEICDFVLQLDPFTPRIGRDERNRRVVVDVGLTLNRLEQCAAQNNIDLTLQAPGSPVAADFVQLGAMQKQATARGLAEHPELVDTAMDLVFRSQADAAVLCGPPTGENFAIFLIGRANGGGR